MPISNGSNDNSSSQNNVWKMRRWVQNSFDARKTYQPITIIIIRKYMQTFRNMNLLFPRLLGQNKVKIWNRHYMKIIHYTSCVCKYRNHMSISPLYSFKMLMFMQLYKHTRFCLFFNVRQIHKFSTPTSIYITIQIINLQQQHASTITLSSLPNS